MRIFTPNPRSSVKYFKPLTNKPTTIFPAYLWFINWIATQSRFPTWVTWGHGFQIRPKMDHASALLKKVIKIRLWFEDLWIRKRHFRIVLGYTSIRNVFWLNQGQGYSHMLTSVSKLDGASLFHQVATSLTMIVVSWKKLVVAHRINQDPTNTVLFERSNSSLAIKFPDHYKAVANGYSVGE